MTEETKPHTLTGAFHVHENFHSEFLPTDRTIIVFVPPGYESEQARRYPVLYLHDGQNIFDKATAFGDEWRVDETAQNLIDSGTIEPLIIVGVYNAGERRIDEYTPTRVEKKNAGGQADRHGQMLVQELKPFIDERYRTLPSAANTALGGSSLGGLATMHVGIKYPTVFGKLAVISPSVWWDDRVILREVAALPSKLPQRIWLDAGTGEGQEVTADTGMLRDTLVSKGWTLDGDLKYHEAEGHGHDERYWAARMDQVLRFLFPAKG
jgi:predicted alpha/beta superfamily hydrolase